MTHPMKIVSLLSEELRLLLRRQAPGMIVVLNMYSRRMYGVEYTCFWLGLLPPRTVCLRRRTAVGGPSAARELLARPLIEALRRTSVCEDEIVEHAARGDVQ